MRRGGKMIRPVGFGLLLASSCLVSLELTRRHKRKISHIEALCRLVRYIKGNIDLFLTPVGGILSSYRDSVLEECGFSESMRERGLSAATEEDRLYIPPQARDTFLEFTCALGTSYREDEVKRCAYCEERLTALARDEEQRLQRNRDLYRYIPPLGALSLMIVLM